MSDDDIYRRLQEHLDSQAVGFPATDSGVEIRILKHIFSPLEAQIASCMSFRPEKVDAVYHKTAHLADSKEKLSEILSGIEHKGGIESSMLNNSLHYYNIPLVIGMYEYQLNRLSPSFIKDFNRYMASAEYKKSVLETPLPQMRTIRYLKPRWIAVR